MDVGENVTINYAEDTERNAAKRVETVLDMLPISVGLATAFNNYCARLELYANNNEGKIRPKEGKVVYSGLEKINTEFTVRYEAGNDPAIVIAGKIINAKVFLYGEPIKEGDEE